MLLLLSFVYVAILFGIASWGDSLTASNYRRFAGPLVYSLSLAVYCTSWTFYGAVGTAAQDGWSFLPIYLGPILIFVFAWGMIRRIVAISKRQNLTSIADFIAARYGRARILAVLVTIIAVVGSVPYIALQLKAVVAGFETVSDYSTGGGPTFDSALVVAMALALFAILFGTRQVDTSEHHHGIVLAIAFESVIKLLAFLAVGVYAVLLLLDDPGSAMAMEGTPSSSLFALDGLPETFITQTILASAAIICLPRQFHITVVEAHDGVDYRSARWMFPLYLVLFCIFIVPITVAGIRLLPPGVFSGDTFVLALPMQGGLDWLTGLAFLGGFSAATGMVIVASVTLSTMVSNEIVMPLLVRIKTLGLAERDAYPRLVILIRRIAIIALGLMAYGYYRAMDRSVELASIGLLSFAAAAQFAPLLVLGMYWPRATRVGAIAGLVTGSLLWAYTLLIPSVARAGAFASDFVEQGPFSIVWLRPESLLFDAGAGPLTHGVFLSLGANIAVFVVVSMLSKQSLGEKIQASAFAYSGPSKSATPVPFLTQDIRNADLHALAARFVGEESARRAFEDVAATQNIDISPASTAGPRLLQFTERLLAGAMGSASARLVMTTALRRSGMEIGDVVLLLDETSQAIRFNRRLLEATLENITQGVSVIDASQQLIGWNSRYAEIMGYPPGLLHVGQPVAELMRFNAGLGRLGGASIEKAIARRIRFIRDRSPYGHVSEFPDGRAIEIRGRPMPDGGYVTTYSDITETKEIEKALRDSEKQVRTYTDNAPAMIAYVDADRCFRFANKAYLKYAGMTLGQITGAPISAVLEKGQLMKRSAYLDAAFGGERQEFELEMKGADQPSMYTLGTYIPDLDTDGNVLGVYAIFQDITSRRSAELGLVEAKQLLEQRVADRTAELEATMTALAQAKSEAEEANASKTGFLAAAAHDLLQPLNAAKLFTALLAEKSIGMTEEQCRLVSRVESGLVAVEDLLSALLDISRLDTRAPVPHWDNLSISELFTALEDQFSESFAKQGLPLRFVHSSLCVQSDAALLRRILQNLISNARRYTRTGRVSVGCRRRGATVAIQVFDTGIGIAAGDQPKVFEEFRRLEGSDESEKRGLGLGLAIVKRIARLLDHTINMRSEVGKGSCFEVVVPRSPAGVRPVSASNREARSSFAIDGHYVVCIDDEPDILDGMHGLLSRWGARPIAAKDLQQASGPIRDLKAKTGTTPAVLLVDYHLGNQTTGIEVINALRSIIGKPTPAVILTADHSEQVAEEVRGAQHALLYKPVKPAALRALINRIIARRDVA
jgi:PAS domain S-box-containing protein